MNEVAQGGLSGERRIVTAVFADVVGSTALMESVDPEDWTVIANGAFDVMTRAVERYEGTVAQLQGDAMVAFFGAPVAHEDDAERAVRAALEMMSEIQGYREQVKATDGIDFQIRAGVNTGPVLAGRIGSDLHREYTAMGDAMNVAARMEAAARPGTVLMTDDTYRLVAPAFDVEDLGAISVKGKVEPVRAYEVVGTRASPEPARGLAGLRSAMVGRDAELETLKGVFESLGRGRAAMACVIGEPGVGKTRLVGEFKRWVLGSRRDVAWVEGRGISYGGSFPYHLVLDMVRSAIGVSAAATEDDTTAALEAALANLAPEDRSIAFPLLAHLLSLAVPEEEAALINNLDPEVLQLRYATGLKELLNAITAKGPLVMLLEDVHFSDRASVELLGRVMALGAPLRTMVCMTARPDADSPGWRLVGLARELFEDGLTELFLTPLDAGKSARLLASLLEIESLPAQARDSLLARADGNPFFIEELIKVFIERGVIVREGPRWVATGRAAEVDIPENLRSLLLARIDRLPADTQNILKTASVVGRQFPTKVLSKILGQSPENHLTVLEASGLVRMAAVEPEPEYVFAHSLLQDAAYESLLKRQRRRLHLVVGEAMEDVYRDRLEDLSAELALHFERAGDERALSYLMVAAGKAQRRFAIHEARDLYERALRILEGRDDPQSSRIRVEAIIGAAEAGWTFSDPEGEIAALEQVAETAEALGDERLLVRLYSWLSMLRQYQGEKYGVSSALTFAIDRANEIGEKVGDPALKARPLAQLGWALAGAGDYRGGIALLEKAVPLLEQAGKTIDLGLTLDGLAFEYTRLGDFDTSDRWIARAAEVAAAGDPIGRLDFDSIRGGIALFRNRPDDALEAAQLCAARADQLGALSCSIGSHLIIGLVNLMKGRPELALPALERGGELSLVSLKFWQPLLAATRATAEAMLGRMDKAVPRWQAALDRARAIGDRFVEASVLQQRAVAGSRGPDPDWTRILPELEQASDIFDSIGARPFLARALRDHGMALQAAGRPQDAQVPLRRALALFDSMKLSEEAGMVRALL